MIDWDVVVAGGGTAGAATALACAEAGLRTLLLERGRLEDAGARWVNGVPGWSFDEARIPRPEGEELVGAGAPMHLLGGRGRVVVEEHDVLEVDMVRLVARLQSAARDRGAVLEGERAVRSACEEGTSLRVECDGGAVRSRWLVDAAGVAGPRLLGQPAPAREDLCAAAQEVRVLAEADGAARFFASMGVPLGATLSQTGLAGGFSIRNVRVHGGKVYLLTGSIPALGHPPGTRILEDFAAAQPWVGPRLWGGARAIPLAAPRAPLGVRRIAAVGDAGPQVFAAHGSGIGIGLVSARMLAWALRDGGGPEEYDRRWRARFLGLYRGYDRFRRYVATLPGAQVHRLVESGLLSPELARAGLDQRHPSLHAGTLLRLAAAASRHPQVARTLLPVVAGMQWDRVRSLALR